MKNGYSYGTFNGVKYHNYKQSDNEKVFNYKVSRPLRLNEYPINASCIVGGSNYFVNVSSSADYGQILGRVQDKTHGVDDAPNKDGFLDWIWDNGKVVGYDMESWDYRGVDFGASPYAIIVRSGKAVKEESSAIPTKWRSKKTQTIFGILEDEKFACTVVEDGVTCDMATQLALSLGYKEACLGDSGGSSIMYCGGVYKSVERSRKLPIAFVFQKEEVVKDMKVKMKAAKEIVVLRETVSFNSYNKPNGKILAKLQQGDTANVTGFLPIQKDGYQWLEVNYNGVSGYMQYDSKCYELEEIK